MKKAIFLCLLPALLSQVHAHDFQTTNPLATPQMLLNEQNSTLCQTPAPAKEDFGDSFRYGCFCGTEYPKIVHASKKNYKELNSSQREELVLQYYKIKPYDDIDALCQQHDICYLYQGKEAQVCNDTLYDELKILENNFKKNAKEYDSTERRCSVLTSDMSTVFKTVFGRGDDISFTRLGLFGILTPFSISSKLLQKTSQAINSKEDYPLATERCLIGK